MTTAPPAADDAIRARLDDRYGRRRGGPSRWVIVLGLAIVVAVIGWFGWMTVATSLESA